MARESRARHPEAHRPPPFSARHGGVKGVVRVGKPLRAGVVEVGQGALPERLRRVLVAGNRTLRVSAARPAVVGLPGLQPFQVAAEPSRQLNVEIIEVDAAEMPSEELSGPRLGQGARVLGEFRPRPRGAQSRPNPRRSSTSRASRSTSRRRQGPGRRPSGPPATKDGPVERVEAGADVRAGVADVEDRTGPWYSWPRHRLPGRSLESAACTRYQVLTAGRTRTGRRGASPTSSVARPHGRARRGEVPRRGRSVRSATVARDVLEGMGRRPRARARRRNRGKPSIARAGSACRFELSQASDGSPKCL